ncbi:MAG: CNNM domain-containing protein [Planctomycetaceae bacterium]|nr:CNNM domain-containing protein [Planctomycetaceae bacterium]
MFIFAVILGFFALLCSAVFSGAETAFYRVPRIRLKIDAVDGNRTARFFMWLSKTPSLFVATLLVSNNIANNAISMATVIIVQCLAPAQQGVATEIVSTLMLAPILFIYGEMFPKYIALNIPSTFLHRFSPILFVVFLLFLPLTIFLWLVNRLITAFQSTDRKDVVSWIAARNELGRVLDEGYNAGVLEKSQRYLANSVFSVATTPIGDVCTPLTDYPTLQRSDSIDHAIRVACEHRVSELPVLENEMPIGYVRVIDIEQTIRTLKNDDGNDNGSPNGIMLPLREFVEIDSNYSPITAMSLFLATSETFGCVIEPNKNVCVGLLHRDTLRKLLFPK